MTIGINIFKIINFIVQSGVIATTIADTISNFTLMILSENICYIFPMSVILTKMIFAFFNENKIRKIVDEIYKPIMIFRHSSGKRQF